MVYSVTLGMFGCTPAVLMLTNSSFVHLKLYIPFMCSRCEWEENDKNYMNDIECDVFKDSGRY